MKKGAGQAQLAWRPLITILAHFILGHFTYILLVSYYPDSQASYILHFGSLFSLSFVLFCFRHLFLRATRASPCLKGGTWSVGLPNPPSCHMT